MWQSHTASPQHWWLPMTDYYSIIANAVSKLDNDSAESRRDLYKRARALLIDQLRRRQPPATDVEVMRERVAFDDAVRKFELESPSAGHLGIEGQPAPANLAQIRQRLVFEQPSLQANEPRGRIDLSEGKAAITLLKAADSSTFMHLSSHLWLDELVRDAVHPNAPQALKEDLRTVLRWLGLGRAEDIGVTQHEQWARGFEQYLAEGRAPSAALIPAFERFEKEATDLSPRELSAPITDEVRRVMDRMLATDQEIAEMRKSPTRQKMASPTVKPGANRLPQLQGALFFVVAFLLALCLEVLLLAGIGALFNQRVIPRGLGWLVLPILAGIAGWTFGKEFGLDSILEFASEKLNSAGKTSRVWLAGSVLWMVGVVAIFLVFDPFGRYRWYETEWLKFLSILFGVPIFGLLGSVLFEWALKGKQ
jgi:hypothetical protein